MERYVTSDTFTLRSRFRQLEESYEYSLATGRAKGEAWVQLAGKLVLLTALRYGPAGVAAGR